MGWLSWASRMFEWLSRRPLKETHTPVFDEQQELSLQGGKNSPEINDPPLRVLRRITYESVEELKQLERLAGERGVDLEPSVYLVPEAIVRGVVQMHAEHLSVLSNAPNKHPRWHVNVSQLPHKGIVRKLGKTKFAFTQQAHACLTLMDEADVDAFADAVFACLGSDAPRFDSTIRHLRLAQHRNGRSTKYLVVHQGKSYPPKYLLSLAVECATGRAFSPSEFYGGAQTNEPLRRLGDAGQQGSGELGQVALWRQERSAGLQLSGAAAAEHQKPQKRRTQRHRAPRLAGEGCLGKRLRYDPRDQLLPRAEKW